MFGKWGEGKCDGKTLCRLATKWLDYYEEVQAPERRWGKAVTTFFIQVAFNKSSQWPLYYHVTAMECLISAHLFSVEFWIVLDHANCLLCVLRPHITYSTGWFCKVSPALTLCSHVSGTGSQSLTLHCVGGFSKPCFSELLMQFSENWSHLKWLAQPTELGFLCLNYLKPMLTESCLCAQNYTEHFAYMTWPHLIITSTL